jgi:hypothetical protein
MPAERKYQRLIWQTEGYHFRFLHVVPSPFSILSLRFHPSFHCCPQSDRSLPSHLQAADGCCQTGHMAYFLCQNRAQALQSFLAEYWLLIGHYA